MQEEFIKFRSLTEKARKILVLCHKKPDGDTLGAALAYYHAVKKEGKECHVACVDKVSDRFAFLPDVGKIIREFNYTDYDLIVVMDAGASYMTKYHEIYPGIFDGMVPVANMDHHASNDNFGSCNMVDAAAASTTVILYRYFQFAGMKITPPMATALLTGIYNDTGSLMHSNTGLEVFEIAEKLSAGGAKVSTIAKNLFRSTPVSTLKLWGRAMENARVNKEGVTVSVLTWKDFEECGADADAASGVVDIINSVPGSKYVCLLNEDNRGNVKGSFRTQRSDVDLEALASKFGGGGHTKAAGFTMPGRIHQEVHWKIVPAQELPAAGFLLNAV